MTRPEQDASSDPDGPAGDLPVGAAVGEYRVERLLGRGGMGAVYLARQAEIEARVAIKVLDAGLSRDPRLVRRFVDEARAVNRIHHPNIIDIFAFGRLPPPDGREFFVMEYVEGETLAARLERGPLPPTEARRLLVQICEALQAVHAEKIVHRDLKPENLWIATPRHGQPYAKVLDFGIAKLLESADPPVATESGVAMGTAHYMAPEQCRGEGIDARADIYAMGVLLYLMACGRLPFEAPTFLGVVTQQITAMPTPPSSHRPVAPRLERLILSCLEKDPALRPQSARALGAELDAALAEALPGETLPPGHAPAVALAGTGMVTAPSGLGLERVTEQVPWASGWRRFAVAAAIALAATGAVAAFLAGRGRGEPPSAPAAGAAVANTPLAPSVSATASARAPSPPAAVAPPAAVPAAAAPPSLARAAAGPGEATPRVRAAARERAHAARAAADGARARSPLEQRGFLKENPFR